MEFNELKQRLLSEGYADNKVTDETVKRLLSFEGKPARMLAEWVHEGQSPVFGDINGVDSDFLKEKLGMKDPALIISYAMLEKDPVENASYLKNLAQNRVDFHPQINR